MRDEQDIIDEYAGELAGKFPELIKALLELSWKECGGRGEGIAMNIFNTNMFIAFRALHKDMGIKFPSCD